MTNLISLSAGVLAHLDLAQSYGSSAAEEILSLVEPNTNYTLDLSELDCELREYLLDLIDQTNTKVWAELLEKDEYHLPTLEEAKELAEALAVKVKTVHCCGCSVDYYWRDQLEFGIYHTYNFAEFKSSQEPGFTESAHYVIRLHRGYSISKLTQKELKALGWD